MTAVMTAAAERIADLDVAFDVDGHACDMCEAPVAWVLVAREDNYGNEREGAEWFEVYVSEFGVLLCEDCDWWWSG